MSLELRRDTFRSPARTRLKVDRRKSDKRTDKRSPPSSRYYSIGCRRKEKSGLQQGKTPLPPCLWAKLLSHVARREAREIHSPSDLPSQKKQLADRANFQPFCVSAVLPPFTCVSIVRGSRDKLRLKKAPFASPHPRVAFYRPPSACVYIKQVLEQSERIFKKSCIAWGAM